MGYRTALATATRGNGGQNEIGPELFEALGVLRTEELAAIHRFDGAEQYFTRAVDFGYSFSIEETFEKWGRDEIIGDYVRLIRTIRPDVILGLAPTATGGGQHHQASAVIAREAFKLAGDPTKYPEQIQGRPASLAAEEVLLPAGRRGGRATRRAGSVAARQPGRLRSAARQDLRRDRHRGAQHAQVPGHGAAARAARRPSATGYQLVESTIAGTDCSATSASLFDGVDTSDRRSRAVRRRAAAAELNEGLAAIATAVADCAEEVRHRERRRRRCSRCSTGLRAVRALRGELRGMPIDDDARDTRSTSGCARRSASSSRRSLLANGVRVEALADDGVVVPGQPVRVSVIVANRGAADVAVKQVSSMGSTGDAACALTARHRRRRPVAARGAARRARRRHRRCRALSRDQVARCEPTLTIPPTRGSPSRTGIATARPGATRSTPTRRSACRTGRRRSSLQVTLTLSRRRRSHRGLPVQYRYEGNIFSGENGPSCSSCRRCRCASRRRSRSSRSRRAAVPPVAARRRPQGPARCAPSGCGPSAREVRVTVVNDTPARQTAW